MLPERQLLRRSSAAWAQVIRLVDETLSAAQDADEAEGAQLVAVAGLVTALLNCNDRDSVGHALIHVIEDALAAVADPKFDEKLETALGFWGIVNEEVTDRRCPPSR